MDRYEWDDPILGQRFFVERLGEDDMHWDVVEGGSGDGPIKEDLAFEILRLAARLREAEELLGELDKIGDKRERDCPFCGLWYGVHAQSGDGCRLHRFLSAGKEG
jgi:hypothetical protein